MFFIQIVGIELTDWLLFQILDTASPQHYQFLVHLINYHHM